MINKDTKVCISISDKPSNFGTTLHNKCYEALDLNFIYKAFRISDLGGAVAGIRAYGIRGCGVSMPFKQAVIPFLDVLDETAKITGAVNTIVNDGKCLTGFNTDLVGARVVLAKSILDVNDRILILGAGGMARAILGALRQLGCNNISVANRNLSKVDDLNLIVPCNAIPWESLETQSPQILINATPLGMNPETDLLPVSTKFIAKVHSVMDVVVFPMETPLISSARALDKKIVSGYQFSLEQTLEQFYLYTGHIAPRSIMEAGIQELLQN